MKHGFLIDFGYSEVLARDLKKKNTDQTVLSLWVCNSAALLMLCKLLALPVGTSVSQLFKYKNV